MQLVGHFYVIDGSPSQSLRPLLLRLLEPNLQLEGCRQPSLVYRRLELNIGKTVQALGDLRKLRQPHDLLTHQQDCSEEGGQIQTTAPGGEKPGPQGSLEPHPTLATACSNW